MDSKKLQYMTNSSELSSDLPKIFVCCHPKDRSLLEAVCKEILAAADSIVFYFCDGEDGGGPSEEDLQGMNLFVPLMSAASIFKSGFVKDKAFRTAEKYGIPVLPIMLETGLEESFNEQFGNLQFLQRNGEQLDATAIPYSEKLKNSLKNILNFDVDREKIRDAFEGAIFLSYRKKDRASAQELIRLIHEDEALRGIAIWYDEFLIPGEDFNKNIRAELEQSDVFVLAVTPHVTEDNNYIQIVEYPMALELKKPVVPCEMASTEGSRMSQCFPGIDPSIPRADSEEIRSAILKTIGATGRKPLEPGPQRDLMMGIAYLNGIGTEKNTDIAFSLINSAAEQKEPEAMGRLSAMYQYGIGVERDLKKAIEWQKALAELLDESRRSLEGPLEESSCLRYMGAMISLAELYAQDKNYDEAYAAYDELAAIAGYAKYGGLQTDSINILRTAAEAMELKAKLYISQGWYSQARSFALSHGRGYRERIHELEHTKISALELTEHYLLDGKCAEALQYAPDVEAAAIKVRNVIPDADIEKDGHYAHILLDLDTVPNAEEYAYIVRQLNCGRTLCEMYNTLQYWYSAAELLPKTVEAAEKLAALVPTAETKKLLMKSYICYGDEFGKFQQSDKNEVLEAYKKADQIAEELYWESPLLEYQLDGAETELKIASLYKDNEAALKAYQKPHELLEALCEEEVPYRAGRLLWRADLSLARRRHAAGDKETAYELIEEAEVIAENILGTSYNYVTEIDLADTYHLHAAMLKEDWDLEKAQIFMEKSNQTLKKVLGLTGRLRELKLYLANLYEFVSYARLNGDFEKANALEREMNGLINKYRDLLPKGSIKIKRIYEED